MAISVRTPTCTVENTLALLRPWKLPWRPFFTHGLLSRVRDRRRAHSEGRAQQWRCSLSAQQEGDTRHHRSSFVACTQRSLLTHNGAGTQNWRCWASSEGGEKEGTEEGEKLELGLAPAYRQLQLEKKKPGYVGRALRAGKGAEIAQLLGIFGHLLESPYGGGKIIANAGAVVIERVAADAQALRGQEGVHDQVIFEMLKQLRLLEVDMEMVRAAQKEETLTQRLETARAHCKQALLIANSF